VLLEIGAHLLSDSGRQRFAYELGFAQRADLMAHVFVRAVDIRPHSRSEEDDQDAQDRAQRREHRGRERCYVFAGRKTRRPRCQKEYQHRNEVSQHEHNCGDDGGGLRLDPG
jgi:hypothetical protein